MEHRSLNPAIVDETFLETFRPDLAPHPALADLPGPVVLCIAAPERCEDLQAFLSAATDGTKVVVGGAIDGEALAAAFPDVCFLGRLEGSDLAQAYCAAHVFVPAASDDLAQQRMIEALACGVPVAATAERAALALIGLHGRGPESELPMTVGAIDDDLAVAIGKALRADRLGAAVFGAGLAPRHMECAAAASLTAQERMLVRDAA